MEREDTQVWFSDEAGIEGDPRTGRAWFKKGSKPTVPYEGCHMRQSVISAVQPQTGALEALAVPHIDTSVFQIFLDQVARRTKSSNKHIVLVVDNASWHHTASLNWHHILPMYLPAYSPDLNPIERLWLVLKNRFFTNWFTRDPDKLLARTCEALKSLIDAPGKISSICSVAEKAIHPQIPATTSAYYYATLAILLRLSPGIHPDDANAEFRYGLMSLAILSLSIKIRSG